MKKIILADQKLNQLVDDITARLLQSAHHKFENGAISGSSIVSFSDHSQVNQFILFRIYQDWNAQVSQLVHPYFDFTDAEVKEGLRRFLNILSGHILVQEKDFEPLVRSAVYNSLKLILNAEDTIGRFFFLNTEAIGTDNFRKHAPYFTNFDFVIQAILKYHEKHELAQVERKVFFEKFDRVVELWEAKEGRSIAEYQRELFRGLTGKELEDVIGKSEEVRANEGLGVQVQGGEVEAQVQMEGQTEEVVANEGQHVETAAPVHEHPAQELESEEDATASKKTVIRIRPESIHRTEKESEEVAAVESKSTTPPWVDTQDEEEDEEEDAQESKPGNLPPWVEEEVKEKSKPVVNPTPVVETKKEDKPRSLHETIANREGKQPSILERGIEKREGKPRIEVRVKSPADQSKQESSHVEGPKTQFPAGGKEATPVQKEEPKTPVTPRSLINRDEDSEGSESGNREARTLAEKLRQQSSPVGGDEEGVKSIKAEQIPVHKQFQYVQKVFGGSSVKFKVVLDKINKTETLEETNEVLDKYVFNDPNVNRNDKVSKEFEAMVRARFQG
jgi:hypothetical protein